MANEQNLLKGDDIHKFTLEEASRGGIASGKARRERATMRATLEMLLETKDKKSGKTLREEVTLGLIKGAMKGNAKNYKAIVETLGENNGSSSVDGVLGELVVALENAKKDR